MVTRLTPTKYPRKPDPPPPPQQPRSPSFPRHPPWRSSRQPCSEASSATARVGVCCWGGCVQGTGPASGSSSGPLAPSSVVGSAETCDPPSGAVATPNTSPDRALGPAAAVLRGRRGSAGETVGPAAPPGASQKYRVRVRGAPGNGCKGATPPALCPPSSFPM